MTIRHECERYQSLRENREKRNSSPLWHRALERYREELHQNDDYQSTIEKNLPQDRHALSSLQRLGPTLKFVDDFSAVIAVCFGADAKLTAFVWGSIRLMLTLASSAGDTLKNVLDMLEELSLTLPRFRAYEDNLEMDRALEAALIDVYTEVICFYARCIYFFRSHPHVLLRRDAWKEFSEDFARTLRRIRRLSTTVESEADFVRMKRDRGKYDEVLGLMEKLRESNIGADEAERVGKTQIALRYANRHRDSHKTILWVTADNVINMGQDFREIAKLLKLAQTEQEMQDTNGCMLRVKNWLTEASDRWLLIFDNADNLEILRHAWPTSGIGSVLLTTRDASAIYSPAAKGFHVQPFDDTDGSEMLLSLVNLDSNQVANRDSAAAITKTLGGLPLALTQIGGFIVQRKMPLQNFLPLYERNASKIDARKAGISDYEHTLSTVWEMSMKKLEGDASTLFNILPYFQPDGIDELVLLRGSITISDPAYEFLHDEMDLGDAEEALLKTGLVHKNAEDAVLSIHRLIQAAIFRNQSAECRKEIFDVVVQILGWAFPDTWSEDREKHKITLAQPQKYGELLLRCSWYLYERECYDIAKSTIHAALETFEDKETLSYASAIELSGLLDLDMNEPRKALVPFERAIDIRRKLVSPTDGMIASSLNDIALAYTEMGEQDKAYVTHEEAIRIRLSTNSDRIGNSYSNMSSLLLRMNKPNEAEEMLKRCPSLQVFTDESFIQTGNPRFSGDMALLSRIRVRQGRLDEALRLASKALAFRQRLLGNRLKTCDSMYDVASVMQMHGNTASAIALLNQLVDIARSVPEGKGQVARAYYKLAVLQDERGRPDECRICKQKAEALRSEVKPELSGLCVWMLW
ncbi:TPR-like protein [Lentithecium fluviatile CBS 122367]|uniref:TPR-like protein n=1 Tax=Lentithecium fluviatile CBS 122367 TaxID=1168545 RepID=A0A6G1IJY3_9PLEO|nr:TPR-like protein [Lentithecium fluviatile CBS 122367]